MIATPRSRVILAVAARLVAILNTKYGTRLYQRFYEAPHKIQEIIDSYPQVKGLSVHDREILKGTVEALICYRRDSSLYGTDKPRTLISVTEALERLLRVGIEVNRQKIQILCNQGRIAYLSDPYSDNRLVVARSIDHLMKTGIEDLGASGNANLRRRKVMIVLKIEASIDDKTGLITGSATITDTKGVKVFDNTFKVTSIDDLMVTVKGIIPKRDTNG